jgi:hypothetical protein
LNFRLENCLNFDDYPLWLVHYLKSRKTFEYLIEDEDERIDIDDFIDSLSDSDDESVEDEDIGEGHALQPIDRATFLFLTSLHRLAAQCELGKENNNNVIGKFSNSSKNANQNINHNNNNGNDFVSRSVSNSIARHTK